jgi:hypothetical protein
VRYALIYLAMGACSVLAYYSDIKQVSQKPRLACVVLTFTWPAFLALAWATTLSDAIDNYRKNRR